MISLDDGKDFRFHDTRKFGKFYLVEDEVAFFSHLGPEPLSAKFSYQLLSSLLATKKGAIKPLLLNQSFIAGLGNIFIGILIRPGMEFTASFTGTEAGVVLNSISLPSD